LPADPASSPGLRESNLGRFAHQCCGCESRDDCDRIALSTGRPLDENPLFAGLDAAPARQFGRRSDGFVAEQGFSDVISQIVKKMHFFPDINGFLLLELWAVVPDLYEKREEERARILTHLRADAAEALGRFASGAGLRHPMHANMITARVA
jgi:hypothetical protein